VTRVVVKVGGRVAAGSPSNVLEHVRVGNEVVVVHGGGPQIGAELARRGITAEFVRGRRVTSPAAVAVVRMSLVAVGAELAAALGPTAVPLVGDEIGLEARPLPELGLVGEPIPCRPAAVEDALAEGLIPVIAPVAVGPLNVNADEAASALAIGLGADRMLEAGAFEGGIVPKLLAAVRAARLGVRAEIGATEVLA
jgi:acetylglutamate kinase